MSAVDRRTLLRLVAVAVVLPAMSTAARAAAGGSRFAPPAGPMLYTRRLERGLADGASLVVSRSFSVRFRPQGAGFVVEGEQVAVEVEAPDKLAEFARIERERREQGLFPIVLEGDGRIAGTLAPMTAQLDEAVREAVAKLDSRPREPGARAELVHFVNAIQQSAGKLVTELPRDLFAPGSAPHTEVREIALPGGGAGEVTVTFSAAADPATGLMKRAVREVVTALDGDRRRTVESWELKPLV
jgi:hypothetical protein